MSLPSGTVTFLLTDIEGSTRMWEEHPAEMRLALDTHNEVLNESIAAHGGAVIHSRGEGDSFFAVFHSAHDAVMGATAIQRRLASEEWPGGLELRVRMGMNTGEGELRDGEYHGNASINPCARLRAVAHGGQVLVSGTTAELAAKHLPSEIRLEDLGLHRLRDISQPVHVFQVVHPALASSFPPLKTLDSVPNNLPLEITSFVGRAHELAEVRRLLHASRLVTLVGVGGVGKTRLALALAAESLTEFEDGVYFVELAALSDEALTSAAVAAAMGLHEVPDRTYPDILVDQLGSLRRLVVLDNCEHVVEACAGLADLLLRKCPQVRILATSRESLALRGEVAFRVPSLLVVEADAAGIEQIAESEAVRLFVARAQAIENSFQLTRENCEAIAQLCQRLDGIPLAIELAAARIRVMSPQQLLSRIEDRFRLLTGGGRGSIERQQTLRATIDWSYALLSEPEKQLFRRLSVFSGGFDLSAVEAVCCDEALAEGDMLDLLEHLVDKSLLMPERSGAGRFTMLETLRQYAREKLLDADDVDALRTRHARYYLELAETNPRSRPEVLENDFDNFRNAMDWSLKTDPRTSARIAVALAYYFTASGRVAEGRARLYDALPLLTERDALRANALFELSWFRFWEAGWEAIDTSQEAVEIAREVGDPELLRRALHALGSALAGDKNFPDANSRARAALEESRRLAVEARDLRAEGAAMQTLAMIALNEDDIAQARQLLAQSLDVRRRLGDPVETGFGLSLTGVAAYRAGDKPATARAFTECGYAFLQSGHNEALAMILDMMAAIAMAEHMREDALTLRAAVTAFAGKSGIGLRETSRLGIAWQEEFTPSNTAVPAWSEGAKMSLAEAFEYAKKSVLARFAAETPVDVALPSDGS